MEYTVKKKNYWMNKKLEEIEQDRWSHNMKQFYRKIKIQNSKLGSGDK